MGSITPAMAADADKLSLVLGVPVGCVDEELAAKMHKAIAVCQFKVEGQRIMAHPEYHMEHRLLLDKIDFENCTVEASVNGDAYVGGIVGYAGGKTTIANCTVKNSSITGGACVAAVMGLSLDGGVATGNTVKSTDITATEANWKNSAHFSPNTAQIFVLNSSRQSIGTNA